MNRVFVGIVDPVTGKSEVYVAQNGEQQRLTRRVRGEQIGYSWDQGGPESIELGRAMLWLVTGLEPPWGLYRGFISDVVAHFPLPSAEGERWRLSESEVREWLHEVGWLTTPAQREQKAARPSAGLRMKQAWEERVRRTAAMLHKRSLHGTEA
jgi:hypothetical protein